MLVVSERAVGLTGAAAQSPETSSAFAVQVGVTLLGGSPINVAPLAASNSAGPTTATVAS